MDDEMFRNNIIHKARIKYIPHITRNISVALELYLNEHKELAKKVPLRISRKTKPKNWIDAIGRLDCPNCKVALLFNITKNIWQCTLCGFKKEIIIKNCPDCAEQMRILSINISRCTRVEGKYNSVWECTNKECKNTIYNKKTIQEIFREETNGLS